MVLSHERFSGLFIPHVTPFDNLGALDSESLTRLTKHFCSLPGVAGLVSCARIGESPVLNLDEKRLVYEVSGKAAREAGKVHIATIAPQSTDEAVGLMRELENLPVDGVMIFPPLLFAWGKVDPNLKVRFFEDLAAETKLPVVLFQIPVKSYYYDPDTICRIARLENVVAFKEASFDIDLFSETVQRLQRDRAAMRVLTGNDRFVAESYKIGAHGALIGVANVATEKWGALDIGRPSGRFRRSRRDPARTGIDQRTGLQRTDRRSCGAHQNRLAARRSDQNRQGAPATTRHLRGRKETITGELPSAQE